MKFLLQRLTGIGTQKVIHDHSTIGIVVTTDGSIGEIGKKELSGAGRAHDPGTAEYWKAFRVLVNSKKTGERRSERNGRIYQAAVQSGR